MHDAIEIRGARVHNLKNTVIPWDATSLHLSTHGSGRHLQLRVDDDLLATVQLGRDEKVGIELAVDAPQWAEDLALEAMEEWARLGFPD
jgi:hypothetical protein